ncbi:MAG TPA: 30S ribosomal protein S6 [Bryobacteraceae bacterium]|jgi:small subunit ribosomal protein S6|nr:30S ribosomal protein S6 [Bryobacteraceae bacterium]
MRIYENLFIVKPDATEEEIDGLVDQMSKNVTAAGGTIDKVDKWGKRRLAYKIDKNREGHYILMQFSAEPSVVKEFERRLRVQDAVIKFLTVRIDETLKRLDKRKKEREKRAHRRPQAAVPQPSLAQQMLGGAGDGASHPLPGIPVAGVVVPPAPAHPSPAKPVEQPVAAETQPAPSAKE